MLRTFLSVAAFAALLCAGDVKVGGFNNPESVLVDSNRVYVSNLGAKLTPTEKDGDGYISLLNKNGDVINKNFLIKLNAPKGMAVVSKIIYVADVDELKGFDIVSKKQVFSLPFDGVSFLNDVAVKDKNTLIVSATDSGEIYTVDIKNKSKKLLTKLPTANGVWYDNGRAFAVSLGTTPQNLFGGGGKLYEINLKNGKLSPLCKADGILDGVDVLDGVVYYSDWVKLGNDGIIRTYNLKTKAEGILSTEKINGAADFYIDKKTKKLWTPHMLSGQVSTVGLK